MKLWRPRPLNRELVSPHFPPLPPAAQTAHGGGEATAAAAAAMAMAAANPVLRQYSMFGMSHHGSPFQHPKQSAVRFQIRS